MENSQVSNSKIICLIIQTRTLLFILKISNKGSVAKPRIIKNLSNLKDFKIFLNSYKYLLDFICKWSLPNLVVVYKHVLI